MSAAGPTKMRASSAKTIPMSRGAAGSSSDSAVTVAATEVTGGVAVAVAGSSAGAGFGFASASDLAGSGFSVSFAFSLVSLVFERFSAGSTGEGSVTSGMDAVERVSSGNLGFSPVGAEKEVALGLALAAHSGRFFSGKTVKLFLHLGQVALAPIALSAARTPPARQ